VAVSGVVGVRVGVEFPYCFCRVVEVDAVVVAFVVHMLSGKIVVLVRFCCCTVLIWVSVPFRRYNTAPVDIQLLRMLLCLVPLPIHYGTRLYRYIRRGHHQKCPNTVLVLVQAS
jgi:hypothetical protein